MNSLSELIHSIRLLSEASRPRLSDNAGLTFLRKIIKGSTDDSYGIEVAKLAGIPNEVIKRAKEVLASVEKTAKAISTSEKVEEEKDESLITFDDFVEEQVIEELKAVDINTLSPYEAMSFLYNLKKRLQ